MVTPMADKRGVGAKTTRQEAEMKPSDNPHIEKIKADITEKLTPHFVSGCYTRVFVERTQFDLIVRWMHEGQMLEYRGRWHISRMSDREYISRVVNAVRDHFGRRVLEGMGWPK